MVEEDLNQLRIMKLRTKTKLSEVPQIKSKAIRPALEKLGAAAARIPSMEGKYALTTTERINLMRLRLFGEIVPD